MGEQVVTITVDARERGSGVPECLADLPGVRLDVACLPIADYLLGDGVAAERKARGDLEASIIDRRLFLQVEALCAAYERPVLIIEGSPVQAASRVHPNAVRGALASVAAVHGVPLLPSDNPEETARLLAAIARQVQRGGASAAVAAKRRGRTVTERQEVVATALPGVGPTLARRLLEHSGSLLALVSADERALRAVEGIGPKRAQALVELFQAPYEP